MTKQRKKTNKNSDQKENQDSKRKNKIICKKCVKHLLTCNQRLTLESPRKCAD